MINNRVKWNDMKKKIRKKVKKAQSAVWSVKGEPITLKKAAVSWHISPAEQERIQRKVGQLFQVQIDGRPVFTKKIKSKMSGTTTESWSSKQEKSNPTKKTRGGVR